MLLFLCVIAALAAVTDVVVAILLVMQACGKQDILQNFAARVEHLFGE